MISGGIEVSLNKRSDHPLVIRASKGSLFQFTEKTLKRIHIV